jgi:hypothetical protein
MRLQPRASYSADRAIYQQRLARSDALMRDIQKALKDHVTAMENARKCAQKGLDLVKAGKMDQAHEAHRKAQRWMEKAKKLEPRRE